MSHSSYTASERRGIILIAFISLLLIGGGISLTLCGRKSESIQEIPVVIEHTEMVDTVESKTKKNGSVKKKTGTKKSDEARSKKTYRRRSPLDEPV